MIEKIRKMKNEKGFTLVELIVVLVILAILAALLIPALTGYIDKANKEKVIAECRMAVMAVQTEATTIYGEKGSVTSPDDFTDSVTIDGKSTTHAAVIRSLAEVSGHWDATVDTSGKVTELVYDNGSWTVTYTASTTTTDDKNTTTTAAASYSDPKKLTEDAKTTDTYK